MIVVDASAAVAALLNDGDARRLLRSESVTVPHLTDSEVTNTLRSMTTQREIEAAAAANALTVWTHLGVRRVAVTGLIDRLWELRHDLTSYDATYVALAEAFDCTLVTADARLAAAPGIRCPVTVVSTTG